jgi:hypothetical protein
MESKNQVEIKRLLGELEACHTVTLDCYKTIAQLKRELTELRAKNTAQAEMALHADARLTQQSELIDSLHQQLQKRIEATEGFLAQMRQLDEANYTRPADDK